MERRVRRLLVPFAIVCVVSGCGDSKKREEGRAQLIRRAAEQLQAAAAKANAFDFDGANAVLRDLRNEVNQSPFADVATYDKLTADIDAAYSSISEQESEHRKKIRAGWKVIGDKLVSPADQASALAEQKRQEEAERARREAEQVRLAAAARARQEAEAREQERQRAALQAQEEQARQAREREEAQRKLAETIKALPALQTALDDQQYRSARAQWILWSLGVKLKALGGKPEKDPDEYLVAKAEVIRRVRAADARSSPVLLSFRDEILDFIDNVDWPTYIADPEASKAGDVPIRFAVHQNQPVLLLGTVFSDTLFNNVNPAMNTPKKRAGAFAQREILPRLLKSRLTERLKAAKFGYVGLIFVYGNSNFVRDRDMPDAESLCLVLSTRDFATFINREQSQEALVRNSAVFLASEGPQFVRVELTLE